MRSLFIRSVVSPLALSVLAGTACAQTWNGGGLVSLNSDWNNPANWTALPPAGGGAAVQLTFGPVANPARLNTNMNQGNPFNLQLITFAANAGGAYTITSTPAAAPLRFNGVNAGIINNTNDVTHTINSPMVLNTNMGIIGSANTVNARSQLDLVGPITEAANGQAIYIRMNANTDVIFSGNNRGPTGFSGGLNLNGGVLVVDNNNGLGRGAVAIQRYVPPPGQQGVTTLAIRASDGSSIVYPNNTNVVSDCAWGTNDVVLPTTLTTTGTTTFIDSRTMNLVGGRNHTTVFAGDVVVAANKTLTINGDTAPRFFKGKIRDMNMAGDRRDDNLGSLLRWQTAAGINGVRGNVTVTSGTLEINCNVATPNNRTGSIFTIGDANTEAAIVGSSVLAGPKAVVAATIPKLFLTNTNVNPALNGQLVIKAKGMFSPGKSPGIMGVNGGSVQMEPGSNFAVTLNGGGAGSGEGFYGQLLLEEGCQMNLISGDTGQRPVLGIDLQTWDMAGNDGFFSPTEGMQFTIIDQDSPFMSSLYAPADSFGYGGRMFSDSDGNALTEGATFTNENLAPGLRFQISYFGGDTGNDVVLSVVTPAPGAAGALGLAGLAALRRRRR